MSGLGDGDLGRIGAPITDADANFGRGLTARILAALFAIGATLALLTIALPHMPGANVAGVLVVVGVAYAVAGLLYWNAEHVAPGVLALALGGGTTLIAAVAYFSAEQPSPLVFLYLWVFLYSAYFLTTRVMLAQIAYVAVTYAILLAARPPVHAVTAWWLVGMGTLAVGAIVIRVMRAHVAELIARLYESARSDPLTGLSNRRGFREVLDLELARARRRDGRLTVIVGDLDRFEEVNARCGRQVGDLTLQRVALLLARGKRDIDALARVGGEEFALVLPDTDHHGAYAIAERLRCELRDELRSGAAPVTISFGIASYPRDGQTAAALLRAADEAV
jgi:diguanylate cyclase (GGDEF)-like protein